MNFSLFRRSISALSAAVSFSLIATAAVSQSFDPSATQFSPNTEVALVVGSEQNGFALVQNSLVQRIQFVISVTPKIVDAGATATLTITAPGTFDLSVVKASQIGVRPDDGVSNLKILEQSAQQLKLSLDLAETAQGSVRTLFIKNDAGATVIALDLTVNVPGSICIPHCDSPNICSNNTCTSDPNDPCAGVRCGPGEKCCGDTPDVGLHICLSKSKACPHPH
jgi:hypothetical protein